MIDFLKGSVTPKDWGIVGGVAALLVLGCAAFYLIVHTGQQNRLQELQDADAQVRRDLARAREMEAQIDELREQTEEIQDLVFDFQERLPETREIPTLVRQFEMIANEIGLRVQLSTMRRTSDENKETIPYRISARGDFHQIAEFINRLERYRRYLKISDIEITEEKEGVSEARFILSTYRFKADEETAGVT